MNGTEKMCTVDYFCFNHDKTLYVLAIDYLHVYFKTERSFLKNYPLRAANRIPCVLPTERNTHDCASSTFNRCVSVFVKADPGTICVGAHVCCRSAHRCIALIVYKISRQRFSIFSHLRPIVEKMSNFSGSHSTDE